ncbi:MAG: hypothetical protein KKG09_08245 [Verrucomicrobia bacterium]|nr:hypothetical protein [Verrucomicrobiota bacterium]MCG2679071.1 hypothetical protein [Kiritimatiellia bacterium]MBU4248406.1 hypothetical protein [Verrucomicrobiota bacterium]MBU4290893.1 hypothetical protein [Verrucomicrobiota bacterium]MBU4428119.1 hypothetical protein [Verrucomicrobiota bacterium]
MFKKLMAVVLALIVLLVFGLQLFLQYGLTDSLRKYVLPAAKEKLKVDVSVEKVGVNLLAGSFSVHGVKVANPPGFQEPEMALLKKFSVKIGIPALLKGGVAEIQKAVVKDGVIMVVRSRDGALNIEPLLGVKKAAEPGAGSGPAEKPASAAKKPVNVMVKTMEIKTLIRYIDYQLAEEAFRLGLDLQAKLKDVANFGNEDVLSGTINLLGTLLVEDEKCAFDINGLIAPIVDPLRLSFDVSGSMQELDLKAFKQLIRKHGIEGGTVRGTATLLCKKGVFDPDKSVLRLTLNKIQLTEEKRAKIPGGRLPESLTILVPIQGTLDRPAIDFDDVLEKTLLSPDMVESVLKGVFQDQGKGLDKAKSEAVDKAKSDTVGELKKAAEAVPKDKMLDLNQSVKDIFGK